MTGFIVIGAAHRDLRGQIAGDLVAGASNPGKLTVGYGGAAFNAARILATLGNDVTLVSPRADDADGSGITAAIAAAGLADRPISCAGMASACYTAILDRSGGLVVALADMALYDAVSCSDLSSVLEQVLAEQATGTRPVLLIDANLPPACLSVVAALAQSQSWPLYAIGTSPAKVPKLASVAGSIATVFLNASEVAALGVTRAGVIAGLQGLGFRSAIVTNGPEPVLGYDEGRSFMIDPPPVGQIVDVTGAGDALAGATLSALAGGQPLAEAVRSGIAASRLVLGVAGAVNGEITAAAIAAGRKLVERARPID